MATQNTNPFVLPGAGQAGATLSGNPLLASMDMLRNAWAGLAGPGGLMQALPITPPTNPEELDRRIAELRSVESWLRMNLSMLDSTIQAMEVQRATIATLRSFVGGLSSLDPSAQSDGPSPLEMVLGLKPAPKSARAGGNDPAAGAGAAQSEPQGPSQSGAAPAEASVQLAQELNAAAQSASHAWWSLLQQQFNQIAAATAATMPADTHPRSAASVSDTKAQPGATPSPPAKPRSRGPAKPRKASLKSETEPNNP